MTNSSYQQAPPKRKRLDDESNTTTSDASDESNIINSGGDVEEENIPIHIAERQALEKFRIESLINLEQEKESNELRRKELDVLEHFSSLSLLTDDDDQGSSNQELQVTSKVVQEILESGNELIKLLVGGKLFITTMNTIRKRENMLKTMLESGVGIDKREDGSIILDQLNPDYFPILLEHLRTGSTNYVGLWEEASDSSVKHLKEFLQDSDFFGTRLLSSRIAIMIEQYENDLLQKKKINDLALSQHQLYLKQSCLTNSATTTACSNQEESDEEWLTKFANITIQEKKVLDDYVTQKKVELNIENQALKEKEAKLNKVSVTFNVRGTKFTISMEKLLVHKGSVFSSILSGLKKKNHGEIFLDRDCEIFSHIFNYLLNGTTDTIPKDVSKRKLVYKEARELKINSLMDFLDPLRYPTEEIGSENLKIKYEEDFIRRLFVADRSNPILNDPYLHLINVFGKDNGSRVLFQPSEPTVPLLFDFENPIEASELANEHSKIFVPEIPKICKSREVFFSQFNTFTGGLFTDMDWSNVFCAGGSVLACLLEIPIVETLPIIKGKLVERESSAWDLDDGSDEESDDDLSDKLTEEGYFTVSSDEESTIKPRYHYYRKESAREGTRKRMYNSAHSYYHHSSEWKNSDVDLFLYGMNEKQAEEKLVYLYKFFKKRLPKKSNDIVITRTRHAVTFKFDSIRSVQVVLRIYKSPSEIIQSFDINCCCVGFDGNQVFCLPRAAVAISTRCNIVDTDRQSTTYELRLVKYALRGFRIGVAGYYEQKVVNRALYEVQSLYFPGRYSLTKQKKDAQIKNVTGLARILMTIHAYKKGRGRKSVLTSIGGGRNLDKTIDMLKPSEEHDYFQVPGLKRPGSYYCVKLQELINYSKSKRKPYFEYSLNNIEEIINTKKPISDLPSHIEWLTIEPGTQSIGR